MSESGAILRDGQILAVKSKDSKELKTGDVLTLKTGGGAGYGPPAERSPALVQEDVEQGFVSAEAARALHDTGPGAAG